MNNKQEQPVSMEPQIMGMEEVDFSEFKPVYGYTATQLAQARQQGAEEVENKWLNDIMKMTERIADLEKSNAVLLEALKELYEGCIGFMSEENADMTKARAAIAEVKP